VEAGARRLALTLGRALEVALLCAHAQWSLDAECDARAAAAARRLAAHGVDLLSAAAFDAGDAALLAAEDAAPVAPSGVVAAGRDAGALASAS
jgi:hypothetical protein